MSKTVLKIICIAAGILFVLFSVAAILSVAAELDRINASGGIIGGADAPMVGFLLGRSTWLYAAIVALALFAATGAGLLFGKKPDQ
ncbi:MAG: hypothetical protein IJW14_04155 [Oscillospiraceae bacterium]|nr:hypothetical protein [Oscillospiraceae bacterium]